MTGQARVCSHAGAIMWKVEMAVQLGLTGLSCTDTGASWNKGTKRNVEQAAMTDINFKLETGTMQKNKDVLPPKRSPTPQLTSDEQLSDFYSKSPCPHLMSISGTLLHKTLRTDRPVQPVPARLPAL
ncbi:uncharacterized protein LOC121836788 [Ixodes scapularis]|uniref:uncharacterized protein LOC121836788 n=1 Tax=Ixodes scapularis TaxID=6945 RepID=UPI001C37F0BF|nr:uncharacterized protein LOC121836788 [Ixodes scapularis]